MQSLIDHPITRRWPPRNPELLQLYLYLAEKTGQLMPSNARGRAQTQQWLMFQMGGLGPMFGQYGYFKKFAGKDIEDPRPRQRYIDESRRLLIPPTD